MRRAHRTVASILLLSVLALLAISCGRTRASDTHTVHLATTTSVTESGVLGVLAPAFEQKTGYHLDINPVGSATALQLAEAGNADVAITHTPDDEQVAFAAGLIARRTPFMHNEFVIVGPRDQASVLAGAPSAVAALRAIAASGRKLASRGDDSGTYRRELALLKSADLDPAGPFILHTGAGMAATLERASAEGAFALSDRATYLARQRDLKLAIVFQGDAALRNTYAVVESSRGKANLAGAHALTLYLISPEARAVIGAFGIDTHGEPLFTPSE
jgi:tungstate transport system substrate-binding protein